MSMAVCLIVLLQTPFCSVCLFSFFLEINNVYEKSSVV